MEHVAGNSSTVDVAFLDRIDAKIQAEFMSITDEDLASRSSLIKRIIEPVDHMDILQWLSQQNSQERFFWQDRDDDFHMAGVGVANEIMYLDHVNYEHIFELIQLRVRLVPGARYYGGFSFQIGSQGDDHWKSFTPGRFVLPQFELVKDGKQHYFAVNIYIENSRSIEEQYALFQQRLRRLRFEINEKDSALPTVLHRNNSPEFEKWEDLTRSIISSIQKNRFEKVVLAREVQLRLSEEVDGFDVLTYLRDQSEKCYFFGFQFGADEVFFGASPECLYKREYSSIYSEAIAGTRPQATGEQGQLFADELMSNQKEVLEHDHVAQFIREKMGNLCESVTLSDIGVLNLKNAQHLYQKVHGVLHDYVEDSEILNLLHPTPAVAGNPVDSATHFIHFSETFHRGWYAGAIGWVSSDSARFCVGIRSGVTSGDDMVLYSGAGILEDSKSDQEWQELELKIAPILTLFSEQ